MITGVKITRFKKFKEEEFKFDGNIVIAGPNNTGKTTLLQAIAAWSISLGRWKELNDFHRRGGHYSRAPIARQAFSAVPLSTFDLLWNDRSYTGTIEIALITDKWTITMELTSDSTEQILVRPLPDAEPDVVRNAELSIAYVPPMTGLSIDEPVYTRPKQDHLLGQSRPGEIIRNLIYEAFARDGWDPLHESIQRLFGYELIAPDARGAHILAEYTSNKGRTKFDIASAGSGFQQVLMLLSFLYTRPGAVLLLDEPDAHLHVFLQDAIYSELRSVAAKLKSQLIIATHSEVIIDSVEPEHLCGLLDRPRMMADTFEKSRLIKSLKILSNVDLMLAQAAPGILYVEGHTDIDILRCWARIVDQRVAEFLDTRLFWKPTVWEIRSGGEGIKAEEHYDVLRLIRSDLPGLILRDRDDNSLIPETEITGIGLQKIRWRRYEIESYLVHPRALARYILHVTSDAAAVQSVMDYFADEMPGVLRDPHGDHPTLTGVKASEQILPQIFTRAGIHGLPKSQFFEIAVMMDLDEIHPEVIAKIEAIRKAFNL